MNYELVDIKCIDMCNFQMYEGKFKDIKQSKNGHKEIYIYANLSNLETELLEDSELTIYAHSYEDLYCACDYELISLYEDDELCEWLKSEILNEIEEQEEIQLCDYEINVKGLCSYTIREARSEEEAIMQVIDDLFNDDLFYGTEATPDECEIVWVKEY